MKSHNFHGHNAHFIGNAWVVPQADAIIPVIDPSDGMPYAHIARGQAADIDAAVRAARRALGENFDGPNSSRGPWGRLCARERSRILLAIAQKIHAHAEELAAIEARDTGKTLKTARNDVIALERYFEYYAGACDKLHGETLPFEAGFTVLTLREPFGITGHIIPWNYPVQIFGRSVGASLAAGNACVVKPAEDASLSILRLAELMAEAGLPAGAVNIVTGYGSEAGAALTAHPGVAHISFTGSSITGRAVAHAAAERHCPVTLELGGKSPQLLFADADIEVALPAIINGIIQNCGQTCSAGSRLLIEASIYEQVLGVLYTRFSALRSGPSSSDAEMGPLVNKAQYDKVRASVAEAEILGLVAARGTLMPGNPTDGFYQEAVLLRDVPHESALAQAEIFGPVLAVMPFSDEEEAVRLANGTEYGLVAGVWTRDGARQLRLARALQCGQVFINNYGAGGGVELPFGGVKASGHGREKGFEALYAFTTLKTVAIRHG